MSEDVEVFNVGDTVDWIDEDELTEDDKMNLQILKQLCGYGPFVVQIAKTMPRDEWKYIRHTQFLVLKNSLGEIVRNDESNQSGFSGFWFKKISGPLPN